MDEHEMRDLADTVLAPILGPVGFMSSDVRARPDHDGQDAFYVTIHFKPDAEVATGKVYIDASEAMFDALIEHGESRFTYLKYDYPEARASDVEASVD